MLSTYFRSNLYSLELSSFLYYHGLVVAGFVYKVLHIFFNCDFIMFLDMYCFHVFCCSGVNVLGDVIVVCWHINSEIVRVRNVIGVCANSVVRICGVAG